MFEFSVDLLQRTRAPYPSDLKTSSLEIGASIPLAEKGLLGEGYEDL